MNNAKDIGREGAQKDCYSQQCADSTPENKRKKQNIVITIVEVCNKQGMSQGRGGGRVILEAQNLGGVRPPASPFPTCLDWTQLRLSQFFPSQV